MLADFPGIQFLADRIQRGHLSVETFGLCISISLACALVAYLIVRPRGRK